MKFNPLNIDPGQLNPLKFNPKNLNPLKQFRKISQYTRKIGLAPGQIMYVGDHKEEPVEVQLIQYNESEVREFTVENFDDIEKHYDPAYINWINLDGINDVQLMEKLTQKFGFHPLMTEDIMNTEHFPKSEEYENHHFFTLKMMRLNTVDGQLEIHQEHLSLVMGEKYLISFQDNVKGDVFDNVRMRINTAKSRLRKNNVDYLFYALIDSVVDQYFIIMEYLREKIEDMEDYILEHPNENVINHIIAIRKQLTNIRKVVIPLKDSVERLFNEDSTFISEETLTYFRDVQDHIVHLTGSFDGFRDAASSLTDMYMSNLSNNLNVIMKTLTIFSLFFVPLTFIAGVYGMNFVHMPELSWKYGYPMVLGLMLLSVLLMFLYMRRKKWF